MLLAAGIRDRQQLRCRLRARRGTSSEEGRRGLRELQQFMSEQQLCLISDAYLQCGRDYLLARDYCLFGMTIMVFSNDTTYYYRCGVACHCRVVPLVSVLCACVLRIILIM